MESLRRPVTRRRQYISAASFAIIWHGSLCSAKMPLGSAKIEAAETYHLIVSMG